MSYGLKKMAIIVTPKDVLESIILTPAKTKEDVRIIRIKVVNKSTKGAWPNGWYLHYAPLLEEEKQQDPELLHKPEDCTHFQILKVSNLPPVKQLEDAEITLSIFVQEQKDLYNKSYKVKMSFFTPDGNPFGDSFYLRFKIVYETYEKIMDDLEVEMNKAAVKLYKQQIGFSFEGNLQSIKKLFYEVLTALDARLNKPDFHKLPNDKFKIL